MSGTLTRRMALSAPLGLITGGSAAAAAEPSFAATLRPLLETRLADLSTPGAAVLVDAPGEGRWVTGLGVSDLATGKTMSPRNHMRIASITKTFVATAVLQLADQGLIGLDDPVSQYRREVPNGAHISIRQLMNMTSGLFNTTEDAGLNAALDADPERIWTPGEVLAIAFSHPPYFPPGQGFHYANTNYDILGLIVSQISETSLPGYLRDHILKPLGLENTSLPALSDISIPSPYAHGYDFATNTEGNDAYLAALAGNRTAAEIANQGGGPPRDVTASSTSYTWASGGMISTLHDLQIWAKALATGSLISTASHQQQLTFSQYDHYGLGITQSIGPMLGHSGAVPGYQSVIGYDIDTGATIVVLTNLQIAPDLFLGQAFPAINLAHLIYTTLSG